MSTATSYLEVSAQTEVFYKPLFSLDSIETNIPMVFSDDPKDLYMTEGLEDELLRLHKLLEKNPEKLPKIDIKYLS